MYIPQPVTQKPSQMFHCIKWQHILETNNVPVSKDGTMKQLLMVFHREHNTLMLCETEKFMNIWPRRPHQDFIMPPNIRLHRHPHSPNCCKILSNLFSSHLQNLHDMLMFMMLYAGNFNTMQQYDHQFIPISECVLLGTVACSYSWHRF